jgi:hypothetical protein
MFECRDTISSSHIHPPTAIILAIRIDIALSYAMDTIVELEDGRVINLGRSCLGTPKSKKSASAALDIPPKTQAPSAAVTPSSKSKAAMAKDQDEATATEVSSKKRKRNASVSPSRPTKRAGRRSSLAGKALKTVSAASPDGSTPRYFRRDRTAGDKGYSQPKIKFARQDKVITMDDDEPVSTPLKRQNGAAAAYASTSAVDSSEKLISAAEFKHLESQYKASMDKIVAQKGEIRALRAYKERTKLLFSNLNAIAKRRKEIPQLKGLKATKERANAELEKKVKAWRKEKKELAAA